MDEYDISLKAEKECAEYLTPDRVKVGAMTLDDCEELGYYIPKSWGVIAFDAEIQSEATEVVAVLVGHDDKCKQFGWAKFNPANGECLAVTIESPIVEGHTPCGTVYHHGWTSINPSQESVEAMADFFKYLNMEGE